ncbi:MAG: ABC transporter ATP-binding protein, partial [Clostridia bacterium]|nr:ABC transporter ATP-binding protein [Clostridia bacterium]
MSKRNKSDISKPFADRDKKTRRRYLKIVRKGIVPDNLKGSEDETLISAAIEQRKLMKKGWSLFTDFMKDRKFRYIGGIAATVIVNLLAIVTPIIIADIVDMINVSTAGGEAAVIGRLQILCLVLVAVAVGSLVSTFLVRYFILGASLLMEYSMRKKIFNKLLDLSLNYFNRKSAGEIMALSTNDLSSLRMAIGRGIMITANSLVLLASGFIYLTVKISLPLTIALLIPFPVIILMITKFSVFIHSRFKRVQETFSDLNAKTEENISGIRIIKSFVQEEHEKENFAEYNTKNYEANINLAKINAIFHPSLTFMSTMAYLIVLMVGGIFAMKGNISLGEFIAANSFIGMLLGPIRFIGMLIGHLQRGRVSLARISELIFEKPDIFDGKFNGERKDIPERLRGNISIKNLQFKYDNSDEVLFKGISTEIKAGQTVAIVGEVGSGKTTIANLLMRIFDVERQGMIEIDGYDITDISLKTLRENIGYVPQDNFLFSDTIAYNIGFSEDGYPMESIEEA